MDKKQIFFLNIFFWYGILNRILRYIGDVGGLKILPFWTFINLDKA